MHLTLSSTVQGSSDSSSAQSASCVITLGWCVVYSLLLWQLLRAESLYTMSAPTRG